MSLEEIKKLLETTGLPVAYRAFPVGNAPPLPFICYLFSSTNNFNADDVVYQVINRITIELYTESKDPEAENAVEAALKDLCWEKSEEYLDDEQCYEIIYEIEVLQCLPILLTRSNTASKMPITRSLPSARTERLHTGNPSPFPALSA